MLQTRWLAPLYFRRSIASTQQSRFHQMRSCTWGKPVRSSSIANTCPFFVCQEGILSIVAVRDAMTNKVYPLAKEDFIPHKRDVLANFSHDTAYLNVLGGKHMLSKLAKSTSKVVSKPGAKSSGFAGKLEKGKSAKDMMKKAFFAQQHLPPASFLGRAMVQAK